MTCNAIVSLQACIPAQLNRTWTQDPVMLEDALGRVTPFHLEFIDSWEVLESVLEARFRQLPGHRKIKRKEYVLRANFSNKDVDSSSIAFNRCFLPGQHYDMSMIFNAARAQNSCPACLLDTGEASDARVKCNGCGLWYQRIVETIADVAPVVPKTDLPIKRPCLKRRREEEPESDDEPRQFRRVRIRCRQRAKNQDSQDEAEFEALRSGEEMIRCICGTHDDLGLLGNNLHYAPSARKIRAWLIQCGDCKAWQHRSCVGTANGNNPPGGFYCEQCSRVKPVDGLLNENVEEYTIKCICDSDVDDGNTVYCDRCSTWQHIACYYSNISMAELESLDHLCVNCDPRPLEGNLGEDLTWHDAILRIDEGLKDLAGGER